jgi:drug/metabolite transporter (DMT)-like permease
VEFLAGLGVGAINVLSITLTILLLGPLHVSPAIVMPVTVAGPVIIMLLIGHFVLKERLNPLGWTASALGVAGIICLTLPR